MTNRANNLQNKIDEGMKLLYENLPNDIAVFTYVYIRDKNDRGPGKEDGEISIRALNKNMTMYDRYITIQDIKELIRGE